MAIYGVSVIGGEAQRTILAWEALSAGDGAIESAEAGLRRLA